MNETGYYSTLYDWLWSRQGMRFDISGGDIVGRALCARDAWELLKNCNCTLGPTYRPIQNKFHCCTARGIVTIYARWE